MSQYSQISMTIFGACIIALITYIAKRINSVDGLVTELKAIKEVIKTMAEGLQKAQIQGARVEERMEKHEGNIRENKEDIKDVKNRLARLEPIVDSSSEAIHGLHRIAHTLRVDSP